MSLTVSRITPTSVTTNMIPQLESTLDEAISDSYSCIDDNGNVVCQVYKATITNTGDTSAKLKGTISFEYTTSTSYTVEDKLPNLKWKRITDATTIGEYSTYSALSSKQVFETEKLFAQDESADYYFVIWIDEIGGEQTDSGTFRATINFETSDGEGLTSTIRPDIEGAAKDIIDLYNDGSELTTISIGGTSGNPTVTLNEVQGIMKDNNGEYRYYGADPNNYVTFNGELWRMIGVFNTKSNTTDTVGSVRIKIIRNESIGDYSWDSSDSTINSGYGVNDWTQADLNTELNSLYYNSGSGTCYTGISNTSTTCSFTSTGLGDNAKNLLEDSVWYLGATSSYTNFYANNYYDFERGTTTYNCSTDDGACPRETTWTGKIGLMYPSDYAYATDLSLCTTTASSYKDDTNCLNNNWLYNSNPQWTISPLSGNGTIVFLIGSAGSITYIGMYGANSVRPSTHLKYNVIFSGGNGTSTNPYTLSLN